jgi:hypothetical protein
MKTIIILLTVMLATFGLSAKAQYSNATLNGQWLMHSVPLSTSVDSALYIGFDGNGNITDMANFGTLLPSKYSVTSGGAVSMTIIIQSLETPPQIDTMIISGQLTSQNYGTETSGGWAITRITNVGALTDTLTGELDFHGCPKNITLTLNSQGIITSSTGDLTLPVSGRVYADSGIFVGHIKTGDGSIVNCNAIQGSWDEFTISGAYTNDSLTGPLDLDSPHSPFGTVKLIRKGIASGIEPVSSLKSKLIVYPNPASDMVTLNINYSNNAGLILNVYNAIGTLVKSETLKQNQQQINVGDLSNGVYIVTIKSKDLTESQRMIIQK